MRMPRTWTFHSSGQLVFGPDAIRQIGPLAARLPARRVLIVTDKILTRIGLAGRIKESLLQNIDAACLFDEGEPEPSFEAAARCQAMAESFRPDALIGLGGGSNMDLAKITATVLAHGGAPGDYLGEDKVPGPVLPVICVPTTAGTGSEVSCAAVLTDRSKALKVGVLSNYLRPRIAVVDPLLTVSCPPQVTADSGIDALTHAIEAYTAIDNEVFPVAENETSLYQGRHPLGDCFAEKAITLIGANLRRAVHDGGDLAAREAMALGATLAGLAFSNVGVALVHALEYPVGGDTHCTHGAGNGLLLPYVMRFNLGVRQERMATIASLLGVDVKGCDQRTAAERAVEAVEALRNEIGIPRRLRDLGVSHLQLRDFAEKAFSIKRILRVNPQPVTVEKMVGILEEAF
jgi:alcohol dehydrogenase class IV